MKNLISGIVVALLLIFFMPDAKAYGWGRGHYGWRPRPYYVAPVPIARPYYYAPAPVYREFWVGPHWRHTPYGDEWVPGHWARRRVY